MLVPLVVVGALLLKDQLTPAALPPQPPAPSPVDAADPQVQYYLTSQSVLRAQDMMAQQGMSPDEASQQAASDVVDEYTGKKG
jgi:hypothetical protein